MNDYERFTRKELLNLVRELQAAQPGGGRANGGEGSEFPVFGEREQQDFEKSAHPIRIFDRETLRYLAVNDAALKLYGYTREEFLRLTPLDTRHPEEVDDFYTTLPEPTGYMRFRGPRRHITKDGGVIVVEIVTQDILYRGRKARLSLTLNVTKRVRMEERLRRREQEFSALAEHAPDIIARFDRDLRYVYVNPAVSAAMGIPRRVFIGRAGREVGVPELLVAVWEREIRRVFETREERSVEFECPCHGGTRHFEARLVPESDSDGLVETVLAIARDITERKRAEKELQRQKKLLEVVLDNLPVGVFVKDAKTLRYLTRNRFSEDRFGYGVDSSIGTTDYDLYPREVADLYRRKDIEALETGQLVEIPEQEVSGKAGDRRIQHVRKVPLFDEGDEAWVIVGIVDDITERKRAERVLRASEEFLRGMIESSRDCIKVLDLDGRVTWINPGGQALMDVDDAAELLGKSYLEFWSGREREVARSALAAARAGRAARFEGCCATAKGTPKWWDEIVAPMFGPDGKPEKLLVVSRDSTERKGVEDQLKRQKAIFEAIFDNLPVGVFIKDAETLGLMLFNRANQLMTRFPAKEAIGKSVHELFPKEQADAFHKTDREALEKRELVEILEQKVLGKSGDVRFLHVRKVPIFNDDGAPWLLVGIADDITERKRAEDDLKQSRERIQLALEGARLALWDANAESGEVFLSERWTEILGEPPRETRTTANELLQLVHPEDRQRVVDAAVLALKGVRPDYAEEHRVRTVTGAWRWVLSRGRVTERAANGRAARMSGTNFDITDLKEAEEELRRQKKLLDAVIEHLPVAVVVKDASTLCYLLRNRMAAKLTGLNSAEAMGRRADDVYPSELAQLIRASDAEALATGAVVTVSPHVVKQLTGRSVRNLKVPVPDETGRYTHLVSIIEDLTDIEATQAALRRSEERLKRLISLSPAAIFSSSLEPPFATTFISENVTAQVGWQPSDFTENPSFWFDHVHPGDRTAAMETVARIATDGRYACDYRFRHKDGSWRWMHDESQVVHDADGTPREAIGIWMDITSQREETEERLQRALRQRDALVREVHHRIKNHLQGLAGLLRQEARAHPGVAPLIEPVVAQMKSVALVYGLQNGVDTAVALGLVLAAICASLENLTPCRIVRKWDVRQAGSLRLEASEAVPIAVAVNELVYNAIKHGERSVGAATIEVEYAERGPRAEIRIANRGALPQGFNYATGAGCGTGLDLVKTLLGPKGSTLAIWSRKGTVETTLTLDKPLVALRSLQTAA